MQEYLVFRREDQQFIVSIIAINVDISLQQNDIGVLSRVATFRPNGQSFDLFEFFITLNGQRINEAVFIERGM